MRLMARSSCPTPLLMILNRGILRSLRGVPSNTADTANWISGSYPTAIDH
jgi:hypothetical protein